MRITEIYHRAAKTGEAFFTLCTVYFLPFVDYGKIQDTSRQKHCTSSLQERSDEEIIPLINRLKTRCQEIVCISAVAMFIALGAVIHYFSHCCECETQESFYQTVLQIHATVITLALTIVTLITSVSYSIYGISAADFFINRKPVILTQKVVVISSLVLLCINIIMHYAGIMQCMAMYIFLASISIIIYSVNEIYPVFGGKYYVQLEITAWFKHMMKKCNDDEILNLFDAFMSDWQEHSSQTSQEYRDYAEIYNTMLDRIMTL